MLYIIVVLILRYAKFVLGYGPCKQIFYGRLSDWNFLNNQPEGLKTNLQDWTHCGVTEGHALQLYSKMPGTKISYITILKT